MDTSKDDDGAQGGAKGPGTDAAKETKEDSSMSEEP